MTLLVSLFVAMRNILFAAFLRRKIITILQKIAINFGQVLLKCAHLLVRALEYFGKILQNHL